MCDATWTIALAIYQRLMTRFDMRVFYTNLNHTAFIVAFLRIARRKFLSRIAIGPPGSSAWARKSTVLVLEPFCRWRYELNQQLFPIMCNSLQSMCLLPWLTIMGYKIISFIISLGFITTYVIQWRQLWWQNLNQTLKIIHS